MKKKTAVDHFGSASAVAKALNVTPQYVSQWGEYIPRGMAYELQVITNNKIKFEAKPVELKQAS